LLKKLFFVFPRKLLVNIGLFVFDEFDEISSSQSLFDLFFLLIKLEFLAFNFSIFEEVIAFLFNVLLFY